ncbi:IclR family transcriptional regulator domain-containing protein [Streptomyces reniochalinae]|uniref:IclR family transcriptional regulator domain-containing protein n=1 Tax=Streptomyces reniochalinae TaxID=2250578 RepID=UPI001FEB441C|nr:IclR family transcriptional regulator C-terminal domain-containing protein [Streptomyces reniochalinae]
MSSVRPRPTFTTRAPSGRAATPLASVTPRTRNDPGLLREELHRVREQGWAEVDEENEIGVRSVAVTVPRASGTPSLAVSLGATVVLTSTEELRSHLPALRDCVEDVGARMHA